MNKKIIHRLNDDDPSALKDLYDEYAPLIYRFIYSILRSESDTQEMVQTIFIKIWEMRKMLRDDTNLKSFLFTVSKNSSYNYLKKKYREKIFFEKLELNLKLKSPDIFDSLIEKEINEKLSFLVDQLPPQRKKIFKLSRFEGKTYKEIAALLSISENTVDTQLRKALGFLKKHLSDEISISIIIFLIKIL